MTASALILASRSASRRAMLDAAGVSYTAQPADVEEERLTADLRERGAEPPAIALALAEAKAAAISAQHGDALVIGSDSVVSLGGQLFDKPASRADAACHLAQFSGQVMQLVSAAVLWRGGQSLWQTVETAHLHIRTLSPGFIETYLDAEWSAIAACVGCFRIEGPGIQLFERIEGDYHTILGMPLLPLLGALRHHGGLPT